MGFLDFCEVLGDRFHYRRFQKFEHDVRIRAGQAGAPDYGWAGILLRFTALCCVPPLGVELQFGMFWLSRHPQELWDHPQAGKHEQREPYTELELRRPHQYRK